MKSLDTEHTVFFWSPTLNLAEQEAAVRDFDELARQAVATLRRLPPGLLTRAGISLATLAVRQPTVLWLAAAHEILGADCPPNPWDASTQAIDRLLSLEDADQPETRGG